MWNAKNLSKFLIFLVIAILSLVLFYNHWQFERTGLCTLSTFCGKRTIIERNSDKVLATSPITIAGMSTEKIEKYFFSSKVAETCGCIYPKKEIKPYTIGDVEAAPVDVSTCDPYVKMATEFSNIANVKYCSSFMLHLENEEKLYHITLSYGPGLDCPSGCFYDQKSFLFDLSSKKIIYEFPNKSYQFLQIDQMPKAEDKWNLLLRRVVETWFRESDQIRNKLGEISEIRPFCSPFSEEFKIYLAKDLSESQDQKKFFWAIDLPKKAECSLKFWSSQSNQNTGTTFSLDFEGTVAESNDVLNEINIFDLTYLKITKIPDLDRSIAPDRLVQLLHQGEFKIEPIYFNPRYDGELGLVELTRISNKELMQIREFPFYKKGGWSETSEYLYWINSNTGLFRLNYKTLERKQVSTIPSISEFIPSPDENKVIIKQGSSVLVLDTERNKTFTVTNKPNSRISWIDNNHFRIGGSKPLSIDDFETKISK